MSVIAIEIEPHRATRVFFDCSNTEVDPRDHRRIELAIEHSIAVAEPEDDAPDLITIENPQGVPDIVAAEAIMPSVIEDFDSIAKRAAKSRWRGIMSWAYRRRPGLHNHSLLRNTLPPRRSVATASGTPPASSTWPRNLPSDRRWGLLLRFEWPGRDVCRPHASRRTRERRSAAPRRTAPWQQPFRLPSIVR